MLAWQGWHGEKVIKRMKKQRSQPLRELNLDDSFSNKKEEKTKKQQKRERNEAYGQAYAFHGCDANQTALCSYLDAINDDFGSLSSDSDA